MGEVFWTSWETFMKFKGAGLHMGVFLTALVFAGVFGKTNAEKTNSFLLSGYSILFWVIYFFPVTAMIIMDYCIGRDVYWRMFWILPIPMAIAYAFSAGLKQVISKKKQNALIVGMVFVIIFTGTAVYTPGNFAKAENIYKIPQSAVDVCDIISEDAQENSIDEKSAIVANELLPYIRQYDGSIRMPYGRDALRNEKLMNKNSKLIYQLMCDIQIDFQALVKYAKKGNYKYLVYYRNELADEELRTLGYERIGDNVEYYVYRWKE